MPHLHRLAIPMRFIHGAENQCYLPGAPSSPVDAAKSPANGRQLYDRHVIPDYGHIDCIFGENASADVSR